MANKESGETPSSVFICRGCNSEIGYPIPPRCPYCERLLEKYKSEYFGSPDYLSFQIDELYKKLGPFDPKSGKTIKWPEDNKKKYFLAKEDLEKWARKCPEEDKLAALQDALLIMQNIVHSDSDRTVIKAVSRVGQQIGQLAEAIENYFKHGGGAQYELQVGLLQTKPRNDPRRQEAIG